METGAEAGGGCMTCQYGKYEGGKPTCKKGNPMQLLRCMGKGKQMPCCKERKKVDKK